MVTIFVNSTRIYLKRMSKIILFSASLLVACEEGVGPAYVYEIIENGDGSCTYNMSYKKGDKTKDFTMVTIFGHYKIGEKVMVA